MTQSLELADTEFKITDKYNGSNGTSRQHERTHG